MEAGKLLGLCDRDCDLCQVLVLTGCPYDEEVINFKNTCPHRKLLKGYDNTYNCEACGSLLYVLPIIDLTTKEVCDAEGNI